MELNENDASALPKSNIGFPLNTGNASHSSGPALITPLPGTMSVTTTFHLWDLGTQVSDGWGSAQITFPERFLTEELESAWQPIRHVPMLLTSNGKNSCVLGVRNISSVLLERVQYGYRRLMSGRECMDSCNVKRLCSINVLHVLFTQGFGLDVLMFKCETEGETLYPSTGRGNKAGDNERPPASGPHFTFLWHQAS